MTAHDVVARVRRVSKIKQVGHAGTLDPMATGVLPVAVGKACRLLRFLADDKTYVADVLFAAASDTDDVEGRVTRLSNYLPSLEEINDLLPQFLGEIDQVPPIYSAVHIQGERAYNLARRGETDLVIPTRRVQVFTIEVLGYQKGSGLRQKFKNEQSDEFAQDLEKMDFVELRLRIHCGSGTYIRSIARDIGAKLGSAACLSSLIREQAGRFNIKEAISLEFLQEQTPDSLAEFVIPPEQVLSLPSVEIADLDTARRLLCGQLIDFDAEPGGANHQSELNAYWMVTHNKKTVAICSWTACQADESSAQHGTRTMRRTLKPEVVLANANTI